MCRETRGRIVFVLAGLVFGGLVAPRVHSIAQEAGAAPPAGASVLEWAALRGPEYDRAVDAILARRTAEVAALISIADPEHEETTAKESRIAAVYLLGELRAVEAAPLLAGMIGEPLRNKSTDDTNRYDYPVSTALVRIRRPAVPALLRNIHSSSDRYVRLESASALQIILGGKRRTLETLAKFEKTGLDEASKSRLNETVDWMKEHVKEGADEEPLY